MRKSIRLSLTATFAALHTILYFISFGLWRNWAINIAPIEGILLGPQTGFLAALLGSSIARMIKPDEFGLWMFGVVAEPASVLIVSLLARAKWKPVLAVYAIMLSAYFIHPFGRALPFWTILDIILAAFLVYPAAKLSKDLFRKDLRGMSIALVLISFVCVATDSLVRIFLLVPCGLHSFVFPDFESLYAVFVGAAISSYIEDLLVVVVSLLAGAPLLIAASKIGFLRDKKSD